MTRLNSVSYTALNIRTHPHSAETYVNLMNRVFDLKIPINLRGESYAILTEIKPISENPVDGIEGELTKYTKIEIGRWFNISTLKPAEEDETRRIQIPEELRPNFSSFRFVFYPRNHYLVIEHKDKFGSIAPKNIEKFFRGLFNADSIISEFNEIELTLIPDTDQLDAIFRINTITELLLVIRRPNTDGLDDLEDEVLERLNNQNIAEEKIVYKSQKNQSIIPDNRTINLSNVAQLNGEVKAIGRDAEGKRIEKSTHEHPFSHTERYSPNEHTQISFLHIVAERIINRIKAMTRIRV
ncbi:DUF4747 family protein [Aeromonas sp. Y318-1]|uniref:DUF4747 family protein n=1 Tax=Aeromonas TaxID=642 RepID=UPI0022E09367|nr:DUF4747 family protein [Aeromonas sp. Y318-1]